MQDWNEDQEWERQWHGSCVNTLSEEAKQISYAHRMGLVNQPQNGHWPCYDLGGKSVIDIGGGPCSLLLKCFNGGRRMVVDPCSYPDWVRQRYNEAGILLLPVAGEELTAVERYDEAWIYNCLQHTRDPLAIIRNARIVASVVRLFEWIDTPRTKGHPQTLRSHLLNEWLEGAGTIEEMTGENGCYGPAFYGVFQGNVNRVESPLNARQSWNLSEPS